MKTWYSLPLALVISVLSPHLHLIYDYDNGTLCHNSFVHFFSLWPKQISIAPFNNNNVQNLSTVLYFIYIKL